MWIQTSIQVQVDLKFSQILRMCCHLVAEQSRHRLMKVIPKMHRNSFLILFNIANKKNAFSFLTLSEVSVESISIAS